MNQVLRDWMAPRADELRHEHQGATHSTCCRLCALEAEAGPHDPDATHDVPQERAEAVMELEQRLGWWLFRDSTTAPMVELGAHDG